MINLLKKKLLENTSEFRYMYFGIVLTILAFLGFQFIKFLYKEIKNNGTIKEKLIRVLKNQYLIGIILTIIPIILEIVLYKNYLIAFSKDTYIRLAYAYTVIILIYIYFWGTKRTEKLEKILNFVVKNRYKIVVTVFIILVMCRVHFSSIGIWDAYIQEGVDCTIIGKSRAIRSDEWLVTTPFILSQEYDGFHLVNENLNVGNNDMNIFHAPVLDATIFVKVFHWGYFLFGNEIGLSWSWCLKIIVMFMVFFEFGMMLTKKDKWLSLVFAIWLSFSPAIVWWSILETIVYAIAIIVLFHTFVSNKELSMKKKILIAYAMIVALFYFAYQLYPAWQVPLAYLILVFIIIDFIKYRKNLQKKDFIIMGVTILITVLLLGYFVISSWEGIQDIMSTKYPGGREETGGTYDFSRLVNYYLNFFTPYFDEYANPCEISSFIYPSIAVLLISTYMIIKNIKNKTLKEKFKDRNNWYIYGTVIVIAIFLLWMAFPWPTILRKITLLYFSTTERTETIFQFSCVILTILIAKKIFDKKDKIIKQPIAFIISMLIAILTYFVAQNTKYAETYTIFKFSILIPSIFLINYTFLSSNKKAFGYVMIIISLLVGGFVNPIAVGTAPITDTEIAKTAVNIAKENPQGIWIGATRTNSQYLVANGIKVLNGINEYPNYDWINLIDPEHKYEEIWNRYAHIFITLDDKTYFELIAADSYSLHLTYQNLKDMNIEYYYTNEKINEEKMKKFALDSLYENDNTYQYIYKIN